MSSRSWKVSPVSLLLHAHSGREPETACAWPPQDPGHVTACHPSSGPHLPGPFATTTPPPPPALPQLPGRPALLLREPPGGSPALACPSHRLGRPSVAGDRLSRLCSACHLTPETQLARHRHAQPLIYETARHPRSMLGTPRVPTPSSDGEQQGTDPLTPPFNPPRKSPWSNFCLPFSHKLTVRVSPMTQLHP